MTAAVQLGIAAGIRIDGHPYLSTHDVTLNGWDELMAAHFHTLV